MADTNTPDDFSFLEMSDEDLLKYSPDNLPEGVSASAEEAPAAEEEPAGEAPATGDEGAEEEAPAAEEAQEDAAVAPATQEEQAPTADPGKGDEADKAEKPAAPVSEVSYEAEYKRLIGTPIKANGREITVASADEAISLMQMGANYNKKMSALKPNLALLKMLENNGLLSEEKLSFLIDLSKKDAGAINKLVSDSGIDPLDLTAEKASAYQPGSHKVDSREIELDAVLDEIQTTPSYEKTITVVGKQWDPASKQAIADEPQLLRVINAHVQSGIYDLIASGVERERMFGRLQGMSDLAAYRHVGDAIQARGGFDHLGRQGKSNQPTGGKVVQPKSVQQADALKAKRLAAGASKPVATAPKAVPADFNPLSMSDEEFAKFSPKFA